MYFNIFCVFLTVVHQLIPYSGSDIYDEEARDVDSSERLANGKGTHDKVYYGDQIASQQNNNHQNKKVDQSLGNKRSHGKSKI